MATSKGYIRIGFSKQEREQLRKVAAHYEMAEVDLIKALIKREALKVI